MVLGGKAVAFQLETMFTSPSCLGLKNSMGDTLVMGRSTKKTSYGLAVTLVKLVFNYEASSLMSICQECLEDRMAYYKKCQNNLKNAERVTLTVALQSHC